MDVETIRAEVEAAGKQHLAAATPGDVETVDKLIAEEIFYTALERLQGGLPRIHQARPLRASRNDR